ncbi:MAG: YbaK/EbsC family protein [Parachlamydiaceae bacterium]|nr:YbaK/EbsC family protein [Parachlamydiaceae bacterium]
MISENLKTLASVEYLNMLKISHELQSFATETEKGAANVAQALGFRERQMIKTLIFETDKGEAVLIMVGGDQNAVSGLLKKALGSRNISMCNPEKVKAITGYQIGSIPPFHWQPEGFRTFLDASIMSEDILGVGTGCWGKEILITPENLVRASNAKVINLTQKEAST